MPQSSTFRVFHVFRKVASNHPLQAPDYLFKGYEVSKFPFIDLAGFTPGSSSVLSNFDLFKVSRNAIVGGFYVQRRSERGSGRSPIAVKIRRKLANSRPERKRTTVATPLF